METMKNLIIINYVVYRGSNVPNSYWVINRIALWISRVEPLNATFFILDLVIQ